ncbi:MAG: flippase [Candidatus Diapherotrites archaeon]
MSETKRIAKNGLVLFIANGFSRAVSIVLVIYFIHLVGATVFGTYSFAQAFVSVFVAFTALGLNNLTIREVAKDYRQAGKYLGNLFPLKAAISTVILILILYSALLLKLPFETIVVIILLALAGIVNALADIFRALFRAFEEFAIESVAGISSSLVGFAAGIILLYYGFGITGLVFALLLASVTDFILQMAFLGKIRAEIKIEFDFSFWKSTLKSAVPFGMVILMFAVYFSVDVFILKFLRGEELLGFYTIAYNMVLAISILPQAFATSTFPFFSRNQEGDAEKNERILSKSLLLSVLAGLVFALVLFIFAQDIVVLLFGTGFGETISVLQIICWGLVLLFPGIILIGYMSATGRNNVLAILLLAVTAINTALDLLLIGDFGLLGVASATVFSQIILFILLLYFKR